MWCTLLNRTLRTGVQGIPQAATFVFISSCIGVKTDKVIFHPQLQTVDWAKLSVFLFFRIVDNLLFEISSKNHFMTIHPLL